MEITDPNPINTRHNDVPPPHLETPDEPAMTMASTDEPQSRKNVTAPPAAAQSFPGKLKVPSRPGTVDQWRKKSAPFPTGYGSSARRTFSTREVADDHVRGYKGEGRIDSEQSLDPFDGTIFWGRRRIPIPHPMMISLMMARPTIHGQNLLPMPKVLEHRRRCQSTKGNLGEEDSHDE
ncbi:hypothetical protein J3459_013782 [Metarhizium acridum]|nr:hypothetical protein J3459_013782 [Metarhizium acridum]